MVWLKIGCINFGGPAGQIAMMHRILVDEKKWIDEPRFLHALNFSMLLPGPEATQLATYVGWLLHGVRGGLAAGILFVLPGAFVMLGLSLLYAYGRGLGPIDGALFGIKAAVLVIVFEALIRIGKRALKSSVLVSLAALAFVAIFFFAAPFPADRVRRSACSVTSSRAHAPASLGLTTTRMTAPESASGRWRHFTVRLAFRAHHLVGTGRARGADAGPTPCLGRRRHILLQARGGDLRRRLCRACLYGAAGGRDATAGSRRPKWSTHSASPRPRRGR